MHQIPTFYTTEQWDDPRKRRLTAKEEIIGRKSHVSLTSWRGWMHLGSGVRSVVTVIPQWGLLEVNRMLCKRFPPSWWLLLHPVHLLFSILPTTMKRRNSILFCTAFPSSFSTRKRWLYSQRGWHLCLRDPLDLKDLEFFFFFFFCNDQILSRFSIIVYTDRTQLLESLIENGQFKFPLAIIAKPSTPLIPICKLTMTPTHDSLLNRELFAALRSAARFRKVFHAVILVKFNRSRGHFGGNG